MYVAVLAINLDVTIVNVALPSMATQLHADTRALGRSRRGHHCATRSAIPTAARDDNCRAIRQSDGD
ncbi:hypothetical protein [Mycobacterium vicinigordonae]|uniref:hypothetical protein n=1 Tax=Mycobacterium vicinigordonae TaxID=1719132 RepID=UPI001BB373EA|nr:hypothetical protein [Mycobacterium vicinigordonae]